MLLFEEISSTTFQVMTLESGETKFWGLGVVIEDYSLNRFPGMETGSVGYHTDEREIYEGRPSLSKKTTGTCLVMRLKY